MTKPMIQQTANKATKSMTNVYKINNMATDNIMTTLAWMRRH